MSTSYYANALIGFRMEFLARDFASTTRVDSCSHQERAGNAFCPICGTRVHDHTCTSWGDLGEQLFELENEAGGAIDCGVRIVQVEDNRDDRLVYMIGYGARIEPKYVETKKLALPTFDDLHNRISAFIERHKLPWEQGIPGFELHMFTTIG